MELWWGYKHVDGSYQVKRFFSPIDIQEAEESPFCEQVLGPFKAYDRSHALAILKENVK